MKMIVHLPRSAAVAAHVTEAANQAEQRTLQPSKHLELSLDHALSHLNKHRLISQLLKSRLMICTNYVFARQYNYCLRTDD